MLTTHHGARPWRPSRALLLAIAASLTACSRPGEPRVVSVEFVDETPDGVAVQDESLRVALDRPLSADIDPARVRFLTEPQADWHGEARRVADDPRVLEVRIATGSPAFRFAGTFGKDRGATGIGVDLGDGRVQWVDLQLAASLPVLTKAVWEDRAPPSGDLVVDQGDWIRLVFDRPVALQLKSPDDARVRWPQDIVLAKASDRLDDGEVPSRFEKGDSPNEVRIVLGSRPVLTLWGSLPEHGKPVERFRSGAPSGLALSGTRVLPMPKITDVRGGEGSVSRGEVDVEFPEGLPLPHVRKNEVFPPPGGRIFPTVTPLAGGRALVIGGASPIDRRAFDQVLVYDPFHEEEKVDGPFLIAGNLPHPTHMHTATVLAGKDGVFHTIDDAVLVAGGSDGERSLGDLSLVMPQEDGSITVARLDDELRVPRAEHAAVALSPVQVLIDGGRKFGVAGAAGIVECAEVITLAYDGGKPRVAEHALFRTLARAGHVLSLLAPADGGETYVLAHGGFGRDRRRSPSTLLFGQRVDVPGDDILFPTENAAVLAAPWLINPTSPGDSVPLAADFHPALLRWGHAAAPLETPSEPGSTPRSAVILIAGGTVRHPLKGFDGGRSLWELPLEVRRLPEGHEAAAALVFRFDAGDPARSRFEVAPHPAPDPSLAVERVYASAVQVPGLGVVLAGGETRDGAALASMEAFLLDEGRLTEIAVRLSSARSRHAAYAVERRGSWSMILLGGVPDADGRAAFGDVEEVPLR